MITLGLPTYNSSEIIWLQLESLCNQQGGVPFELIIIEEPSSKYFGKDGILEYVERLEAVGMVNFKYIDLEEWIPLSKKWLVIRDNMSEDSEGLLLCASDNYSPPYRIKETYQAFKDGFDWVQWTSGRFYNILNHSSAIYKAALNRPALFMGIGQKRLKRFKPVNFPTSGIDTWLYMGISPRNIKQFPYCDEGVHTDGYNTISFARRDMYNNSVYFDRTDADETFNKFPKDIQDRLTQLC